MKIKHREIEIPSEAPFANCKLEREPYAKVLTEIVASYADGFVLAINNEWGAGKTTFVRMWQQHLNNTGFQTVYFNAWENDFNDNPLIALMSELKPLTKGKVDGEKIFKSVVEKGAILVRKVVPALVKSLAKEHGVDTDMIVDVIGNATDAGTELLEREIRDYSEKKKTILEFRGALEKFLRSRDTDKPLIFIVDELDRCRPNYAVEVLEQLKHFFSVNGVVFVLSIDKIHLASSVKGFYGSSEINTEEYLRRFIDLEYSLPRPSGKMFCRYLFEYYEFEDFFNSSERRGIEILRYDSENLLSLAEVLFTKVNATLRQQEKVFGQTRLILNSFKPNSHAFPHVLLTLVFIRTMHPEFYKRVEADSFGIQELSDELISTLKIARIRKSEIGLLKVIAFIVFFYNNSQNDKKVQLIPVQPPHSGSIKIGELEGEKLADLFRSLDSHVGGLDLNYFLPKINLTESVKMN